MYQYRKNDLFYDIEVRNNLFVDSQYLPKMGPHGTFIISFLDATDPQIHQDKRLFLTKERPTNILFYKYAHNSEAERRVIKHIKKTNPTLTRAGVEYKFENLLVPKDMISFLKRLGLTDQFTAVNGRYTKNGLAYWRTNSMSNNNSNIWSNDTFRYWNLFQTENQINQSWIGPNNQFNNNSDFGHTYYIGSNNNVNQYDHSYYPIKLTDHDYDQYKNTQGFRFGYNSGAYDMTMLATIASRVPMAFVNNFAFLTNKTIPQYHQIINQIINDENTYNQFESWLTSSPYNQNLHYINEALVNMISEYSRGFNNKSQSNDNYTGLLEPNEITNYNTKLFENEKDKKNNWMPQILSDKSETLNYNVNSNYGLLANDIFKGWRASGRYIDIMRFNKNHLSLKRAAGMIGLQIKESSTNSDPTVDLGSLDDIADVIAYNVSDVYATKKVFEQKAPYQSTFDLNQELLKTYPYLVYAQKNADSDNKLESVAGDPLEEIRVRPNRLYIDSTATQYITNVIAPYKGTEIKDSPAISFMYPDEQTMKKMAKEGIIRKNANRFDVLEDTMQWAIDNIPNGEEKFMPIYNFYKQFRGKNVNRDLDKKINDLSDTSIDHYYKYTPYNSKQEVNEKIQNWNMKTDLNPKSASGFYYDANGNITASTWNVSAGGIHGAETKLNVYLKEHHKYLEKLNAQNQFMLKAGVPVLQPHDIQTKDQNWIIQHPDKIHFADDSQIATNIYKLINRDAKFSYTNMEGKTITCKPKDIRKFFASKSNKLKAFWRTNRPIALFQNKDGKYKVADSFAYVSVGIANHEDFSSYYPRLISMLAIFRNADGVDTYYQLYRERLKLKAMKKDMSLPKEKRDAADRAQAVRKLLLNSGSGGGDANFESRIKCNNKIVSMRIIGQLFAWRIGQALALHGARVPSTNTDGLYTMDINKTLNNKILDKQVNYLMLDIDPEIINKFVSKDANNRLEQKIYDGKPVIVNAKGGTLTAWKVGDLGHNVNHPAIIDRVLAYYLSEKENPSDSDFDRPLATKIYHQQLKDMIEKDPSGYTALNYLQWITVSSPSSNRYLFANVKKDDQIKAITLPHTNRFFLIKENSPIQKDGRIVNLRLAGPQTVNPNTVKKRIQEKYPDNEPTAEFTYSPTQLQQNDPIAKKVLADNLGQAGLFDNFWKYSFNSQGISNHPGKAKDKKLKDFKQIKISNLDSNQPVYINNQGLNQYSHHPQELHDLLNSLDDKAYLNIIERWFNKSWKN